jgi:hypothetical protein
MKTRISVFVIAVVVSVLASCLLPIVAGAQEKYFGPGFPLRPLEFLSSYRTFDGEVAEVRYHQVRTLKHGDRFVAYRKIVIHVKTNSVLPWKKEFLLTGWMVGGYLQTMEWEDNSCEGQDISMAVTFSSVRPADMNAIRKAILSETGDKEDASVWFWKGDSSSPW